MPHLVDIVTDLVNEIKESKEVSARLFALEQIKEIVFHRDKTLLKTVIPILSEFIVDKSASIRKFLLKIGGDAMQQDASVFPNLLSMIGYILHDPNDGVMTLGIKQFQAYYIKFALMIAEMPATSVKGQSLSDPKQLWALFGKIQLKFNEVIASTRSDGLKLACLELYETEIHFGLPSGGASADSRPQRVDPRLARMQETKEAVSSSESIPLHHPIINRNTIISEAEDLYARMLVWTTSSGPQGFPFSTSLKAALGRIVADVASAKPANGVNAAKALYLFIQGKGSIVESMSGENRESIARAAHRMVRSVTVFKVADPDGALVKLKSALEHLESLGFVDKTPASAAGAVNAGKRDRKAYEGAATVEDAGGEADESEESQALQEAAKRAVDLATAAAGTESAANSGGAATGAAKGAAGVMASVEADTTVLCTDVDRLNGDDTVAAATYLDMSFLVVKQLMVSFDSLKQQSDAKALQSYSTLCVRTIMSLLRNEMASVSSGSSSVNSSFVSVRIISAVSNSPQVSLYFPSTVPDVVDVPKSMWIFLCFILDSSSAGGAVVSSDRLKEVTEKMDLLLKFTSTFCTQFLNLNDTEGSEGEATVIATRCYDAFCLCLLSRLVQTVHLRPLAKEFLLSLPRVPVSSLHLLFLLLATGSKPDIQSVAIKSNTATANKYRGTRQEALQLLSALVFHTRDTQAATSTLNHLLWNCVSEDFEVRAKAVNILIADVLFAEEWCDELILKFALHSVISVMEAEVGLWFQKRNSEQEEGTATMLQPDYYNYSLLTAYESYDKGGIFQGTFETAAAAVDLKRSFHLLLQLCLQNKLAVGSLIDVYCLCCSSFVESKPEAQLGGFVLSELRNLLLALSQKDSIDAVVEVVVDFALQHEQSVAYKVLGDALSILFQDWVLVPTKAVMDKVVMFIKSYHATSSDKAPMEVSVAEGVDATAAVAPISLSELSDTEFRLIVPLLSGFSASEVQSSLYRILRLFSEDSDSLQSVFYRITKSRPPVLSKTQLIVDLHRLNVDGELKPKTILDAIAVCLNNKSDYSVDIIKEALKVLLADEVPAFPLMRTAILASQSYSEVRRYVISEIIPALIKKKVWASAAKVWEGVIYVVKHSSASSLKNDYVLKAILSVPGVQLRSVVKSAPNAVEPLSGLLHSLTVEEKEDMLSGRWLDDTIGKAPDQEKVRVVQELLAAKTQA